VAVPAIALRLALGREMAEELVLGGQYVLPAALQARGYRFAQPSLDQAVRAALAPAG
jgi:NAD dependent epimerase/dehydratase family enzyme